MDTPQTQPAIPGLPENAYRPLNAGEKYEPLIAAERSVPEVTTRATVLGLAMTVLFSAAAAYIALKLGQGIETAIPIAILAVGCSALLAATGRRPSTMLENLQVATLGATAGIVVGGSVFVMPAIFVLGLEGRSGFTQIFLVPFLGAVLGVLFLIPFRRYFVAEMHGKLPFPEATATTEILVTGERGGKAAGVLLGSMGLGFVLDYLAAGFEAWRDTFSTALVPLFGAATNRLKAIFTLNTSAAVMGLGYIIGVRYAAIICAGSFLSYWVLVPLVAHIGAQVSGGLFPGMPPVAGLDAEGVFGSYVRLIGIGGIFAAGLISIAKMSPVIVQALRTVLKELTRLKSGVGEALPRTERDVPMGTVAVLTAVTAVAIGVYFRFVVLAGVAGATGKALIALLLTLLISFLFAAVSAWAVAMISITPVSGMTLTTLIVSAVILARLGLSGGQGMLATLLIGGVVCTALSMTGSMVTLMKIGYWLGGTPRRIQWSLLGGAALASLTVTGVMILFASTQGYVASPAHPNPLPAPQANAMAAVARSMMASGEAPWFLYGLGAVIAVVVELTGVSGLAFALGMYLPMDLNTPLLVGAIVAWFVKRSASGEPALEKARGDRGTLVASGLIAGGALAGVFKGIMDAAQDRWKVHLVPDLGNTAGAGNWLGLAVFLALGLGIFLDARRARVS
ncbi:MAG TPA: oligopeptide transporter, OPT family [Thermoanaerobaculaceae bacterium]|nr:oligopeptide transporter, OPT family [Thermoanaerobaculaceae bacterium]